MAKICPVTNEKVLYLDCLDCDEKECQKSPSTNEEIRAKRRKNESTSEKTA